MCKRTRYSPSLQFKVLISTKAGRPLKVKVCTRRLDRYDALHEAHVNKLSDLIRSVTERYEKIDGELRQTNAQLLEMNKRLLDLLEKKLG
ncbi:MAG: hypothetical protein JNM31_16020 [Flavobacteriales bacterium]|nr:hypothetical protein [Flavobacteriales bacterium]